MRIVMIVVSKLIILFLRIVYSILKLFPVETNKILFCSRQSTKLPLDFGLLQDYLKNGSENDIKIVSICNRFDKTVLGGIKFVFAILRSLYHLATSKICIIDAYWPPVSILSHKEDLVVIQMWHSIGKIKKSGYAAVGMVSGRSQAIAKALRMHCNYDYVIAGAKSFNKFYCESFNINEDKILNYGLPRIDYLLQSEKKNRQIFFEEHPEFVGKKVVLYVPTFRKNMKNSWYDIVQAVKDKDIELIVSNHPGVKTVNGFEVTNVHCIENWMSIDLLAVCDAVITDYSAIALEAAVLSRKTYYWLYDYDEYIENNGLNIKLMEEMPNNSYKDVDILLDDIENDVYDEQELSSYREKYLLSELGNSTEKISCFVEEKMRR